MILSGLSGPDRTRATLLAKSFRARWVPVAEGYAMAPSVMARFGVLYEAAYTCAYRNAAWRYGVTGERLTLDRYEAVRRAKEAVCLR